MSIYSAILEIDKNYEKLLKENNVWTGKNFSVPYEYELANITSHYCPSYFEKNGNEEDYALDRFLSKHDISFTELVKGWFESEEGNTVYGRLANGGCLRFKKWESRARVYADRQEIEQNFDRVN